MLAVQNLCVRLSSEQFNLHLATTKVHCCQGEQQPKVCLESCPGAPRSALRGPPALPSRTPAPSKNALKLCSASSSRVIPDLAQEVTLHMRNNIFL